MSIYLRKINLSRQKEWVVTDSQSFIKKNINTGALFGEFGVGKREENSQSSFSLINSFSKYSLDTCHGPGTVLRIGKQ